MTLEKYIKIYEQYKDKNNFVKVAHRKYPKLKKHSLTRRWYDCKKITNTIEVTIQDEVQQFTPEELSAPNKLRLINIDDMKRFNMSINDAILKSHGFNVREINWLLANNIILKNYTEKKKRAVDSDDDFATEDE